jgi:hypothetical protein
MERVTIYKPPHILDICNFEYPLSKSYARPCFHLYSPLRATSKELMECVVQFINYQPAPVALQGETETWDGEMAYSMFGVPSRPFKDIFGYGELMEIGDGRSSVACDSLKTAQPLVTPTKKRYGLFIPMSASSSVLQSSMVKGRF